MAKRTTQEQLTHRINRIQGQLEAIKKRVNQAPSEQDCIEILRLVKAVTNATKKLGAAYVNDHLQYCLRNDIPREQMEEGLKEAISSAFSL